LPGLALLLAICRNDLRPPGRDRPAGERKAGSDSSRGRDMRPLVSLYFSVWRLFVLFRRAAKGAQACFVGLWLGVLTREQVHAIDEKYYTRAKGGVQGEFDFHSKQYNRRGLFDWERSVIPDHFGDRKNLLVYGAGGGRDTLALRRLGYLVDGFESHPDLVAVANELLREEGYEPTVPLNPRDEFQDNGKEYDGIILSFGT
jgi:hypothetical protein